MQKIFRCRNINKNQCSSDILEFLESGSLLYENLETWMSDLPSQLKKIPVNLLAIPGSHNSMTYTIQKNNDVGPDETKIIRAVSKYFPFLVKPIIFNWCINQYADIIKQLNGGIRYLDLRVAVNNADNNIYFLHGLYGMKTMLPLSVVTEWLNQHPYEIIILDFQHFYNFKDANHRYFIAQITEQFHGKICPVQNNFDYITVEWLNAHKYQVLIIYRNIIACEYSKLWPSGFWPTPWPNTVNPNKLLHFLNNSLQERTSNFAFISQCLLTPNTSYVIKHIFGNLHKNLESKCRLVSFSWIIEQNSGKGGINIVITDDISFNNFMFSKLVIQCNKSLL